MTTWYVQAGSGPGDGTSGAPWPTIGQALQAARAGDSVRVRNGVYREIVSLNGNAGTLEAAEGHAPVIDGGYGPQLFGATGYTDKAGRQIRSGTLPYPSEANKRRGNWPLAAAQGFLVRLGGRGNTLRGFHIVNVCGRSLVLGGEENAAEDCTIDFAYGGPVYVAGNRCRLRRCTITRGSMKEFDPTRDGRVNEQGEANSARVQTSVIVKGTGNVIEDCVVAYCFGEGIAAAKGAKGVAIRRCKIDTTAHWGIGINHASDVTVEGCVLVWDDALLGEMGRDKPGDLLTISAEREDMAWDVAGVRIVNNLFIGGDQQLLIASGASGRRVRLSDAVIANNTFVGGAQTRYLVSFGGMSDQPHRNVVFADNVLLKHPSTKAAASIESGARAVVFTNNLSNAPLPGAMAGRASVVVGAAERVLAGPTGLVAGTFDRDALAIPDGRSGSNLATFAPAAGGRAIGMARDGGNVGAVVGEEPPEEEPPEEPPIDPEPPEEPEPPRPVADVAYEAAEFIRLAGDALAQAATLLESLIVRE